MPNSVDGAIARLQDLSQACTSLKIRGAPDYPVSDASVLPMSIAHIASGTIQAGDATQARIFPTINVDFHFSLVDLKAAFKQADAIAQEFGERLAGDPRLGGAVSTIVFPVNFTVTPASWDKVTTLMVQFTIQVKLLKTPTVTP